MTTNSDSRLSIMLSGLCRFSLKDSDVSKEVTAASSFRIHVIKRNFFCRKNSAMVKLYNIKMSIRMGVPQDLQSSIFQHQQLSYPGTQSSIIHNRSLTRIHTTSTSPQYLVLYLFKTNRQIQHSPSKETRPYIHHGLGLLQMQNRSKSVHADLWFLRPYQMLQLQ